MNLERRLGKLMMLGGVMIGLGVGYVAPDYRKGFNHGSVNVAWGGENAIDNYFDKVVDYSGYEKFRVTILSSGFDRAYSASGFLQQKLPKKELGFLFDQDNKNGMLKGVYLSMDNHLIMWAVGRNGKEFDAIKKLSVEEARDFYFSIKPLGDSKECAVYHQPPQ